MEYRTFGKLDWKPSALGFGCMRLPTHGDHADIDEPEATRMIRYAIDHGVNYVDTAYPYHKGNSELVVGRALQDGYREKVRLATKMPVWQVEDDGDLDKFLNEQLEKLQTEHIDFYLLHALNKERWEHILEYDIFGWADKAIADGRIGHMGFSFHDEYELFEEMVDAYDWTFCQIQYNYMDIETQAGTKGLKYAASKGLAVVVMEPLLGGKLVSPPEPIQEIWARAENERSPVGWALQWLWDQPEVSVVLSGMTEMSHVVENVECAERSGVGLLTPQEHELIAEAREKYEELCPIPCTSCGYCMPCPNGVDIPANFSHYNDGVTYNNPDLARTTYQWIDEEARADHCIQCLECEDKCPQSIEISEWMPRVHAVLAEGEPYDCELP